ncbi:hypothetical protein F4604DRAFT_1686996 [Suillus subluteus]|nr:hypothetical protein F4604DRAFT_1686996 [Suillus subluteus]
MPSEDIMEHNKSNKTASGTRSNSIRARELLAMVMNLVAIGGLSKQSEELRQEHGLTAYAPAFGGPTMNGIDTKRSNRPGVVNLDFPPGLSAVMVSRGDLDEKDEDRYEDMCSLLSYCVVIANAVFMPHIDARPLSVLLSIGGGGNNPPPHNRSLCGLKVGRKEDSEGYFRRDNQAIISELLSTSLLHAGHLVCEKPGG